MGDSILSIHIPGGDCVNRLGWSLTLGLSVVVLDFYKLMISESSLPHKFSWI